MKKVWALLAALAATLAGMPASAATYLFDFHFDAITDYAATNIRYSADSFNPASLDYVSGDVNGFTSPTIGRPLGGAFAPADLFGNGFAPAGTVTSFFFRADVLPSGVGVYASTDTAGRAISDGAGSVAYRYTSGTLTISEVTDAAVPEPSTWAMMIVGFGLVGGALRRRRQPVVRFGFA